MLCHWGRLRNSGSRCGCRSYRSRLWFGRGFRFRFNCCRRRLGFHLGFGAVAARAGRLALTVGWAIQLVDIGLRCFKAQHPLSSVAVAVIV